MCCIFQFLEWTFDALQRTWSFLMACCIAGSLACLIMCGALAGVSLGYNYSLAEFIDLRESNVSVYMRRGVFEDNELGGDSDFRRSRQTRFGEDGSSNVITAGVPDEDYTPRIGRRMDDSIFETDDQQKFDASLVKFTDKPMISMITETRFPNIRTWQEERSDQRPAAVNSIGSLQSMINARKMKEQSLLPSRRKMPDSGSGADIDQQDQLPLSVGVDPGMFPKSPTRENSGRRVMDNPMQSSIDNSLFPRDPNELMSGALNTYDVKKTVEPTMKPKVLRPTGSTASKHMHVDPVHDQDLVDFDAYNKFLDNADPTIKNENDISREDYDDVKGVPVRRKKRDRIGISKGTTVSQINNSKYTRSTTVNNVEVTKLIASSVLNNDYKNSKFMKKLFAK